MKTPKLEWQKDVEGNYSLWFVDGICVLWVYKLQGRMPWVLYLNENIHLQAEDDNEALAEAEVHIATKLRNFLQRLED